MSDSIDLAALRRLAEKATPGRWYRDASNYRNLWVDGAGPLFYSDGGYALPSQEEDGDFIAAANPRTVLALLDRLAAAERVVNECRIVADLDVSNHPLCNSDMRGINEAFRAYDRAITSNGNGTGEG